MQHRYDTLADAVLSGHRTKCFFAGVDDLATARYVTTVLGHEHVHRRSWSKDRPKMFGAGGPGRDSISESEQREEFAPANALRQMKPGEAVLLHGTLPPIHLRAVRWWKERALRDLVGAGRAGGVKPPKDLSTCLLTNDLGSESDEALGERSFESALTAMPCAPVAAADGEQKAAAHGSPTSAVSVATCERCRTGLIDGEARYERRGTRTVTSCSPTCAERAALRSRGLPTRSAAG
jgi:hypothetical protein